MALATTSSAASQLDMGRLFPCCWPASFCHWVNQSSQFKCKYTLWKDWFYQKLILNILHSCAVHSPGSTVLLVVPLTSIAEEVERECHRLGIRVVVGGQVIVHECFPWINSCLQYQTEEFKAEMQRKPQIVICSAEFLASKEAGLNQIFFYKTLCLFVICYIYLFGDTLQ